MAECPGIWRLARTRDGGLARLRLPGGRLTAVQMDAVAALARERGNGLIDLTHRANLQIRGLDPESGPQIAARLAAHGLMAREPRADRLRNILAPPLTGEDPAALLDLGPVVAALDEGLQATPALFALSPKFSFVLDDGGGHGIAGLAHDVGLFAETGAALRVSLAGVASRFRVPPARAAEAAIALAGVAVDLADEGQARTAPLVGRLGPDRIVARAAAGTEDLFRESGTPKAGAPRLEPVIGPRPERRAGRHAFGLGVPLSRLTAAGAATLAGLARAFGDGRLALTPWQAVFLTGVATASLPALRRAARAAGFLTDPEDLGLRILACAGAAGCERTRAPVKADAAGLRRALAASGPAAGGPLTIHLSGCGRGCAHPGEADILLLGDGDHDGYRAYRHARAGEADGKPATASGVAGADLAGFVTRVLTEDA